MPGDEQALARGVYDAYTENNLRYSQNAALTMWEERNTNTNLPAQLFFKAAGFRAVTVLRAYYEDSPEDAYLMQFRHVLGDLAAAPTNRIDRMAG